MKTTLDLPDEIVREMKLRAVVQGRTLKELVADLLREGLGMAAPRQATKPPPSSPVEIGSDGLPVIRGRADAPARLMSAEALIEFEQKLQAEAARQAGLAAIANFRGAGRGGSVAHLLEDRQADRQAEARKEQPRQTRRKASSK